MSIDEKRTAKRIADSVANLVSDLDFEDVSIWLLESAKPIMGFAGPMAYVTLFPVVEGVGLIWPNYQGLGGMLAGSPQEFTETLRQAIEEKRTQKDRAKALREKTEGKTSKSGIISSLKNLFKKEPTA